MKIYVVCAALTLGLIAGCRMDDAPRIGTTISELPPAVQNTVRNVAPNGKITDIDKEIRSGRTIYEISFAEPGINPKIHVAADGTIVK